MLKRHIPSHRLVGLITQISRLTQSLAVFIDIRCKVGCEKSLFNCYPLSLQIIEKMGHKEWSAYGCLSMTLLIADNWKKETTNEQRAKKFEPESACLQKGLR